MQNQKSAIGVDGNIAALIGWIIGIVALVLIFIEKENRFVRFQAIQATIFHVGFFAVYIVLAIIVGILSVISSYLGFLGILLLPLWLVWFGVMIYGAIKSFQGQNFKLPIIGDLAEKWA